MEEFAESGEFFSQERMMGLDNILRVNSHGAFQPFSSPIREEREKEVEVQRVERVEERSVEVEKDCEIIGASKKRAAPKKKKPTKVEVKVEGEEANRNWLDSEVHQLIALKGEMEPEFERNGKKQGE